MTTAAAPETAALFDDRRDAGRRLAARLDHLRDRDLVVLGIPRGGLPVAHTVAVALAAPLDVIMVGKLGIPPQPEIGFGAVSEDGDVVIDNRAAGRARLTRHEMNQVEQRARQSLRTRTARVRRVRPRLPLLDRTALIVDDGVATGSTIRAACMDARARGARRIVLAIPVVDRRALPLPDADEVICLASPTPAGAIGRWYRRFDQVTDDEIIDLLRRAAGPFPSPPTEVDEPAPLRDEQVRIAAAPVDLYARLTVPREPVGFVIIGLASAAGRYSPRTRFLAGVLHRAHLATLAADLLDVDEEVRRARVFDVAQLSRRLVVATRWAARQPETRGLPLGYFGTGTAAAAALRAAAVPHASVDAVVCHCGRTDLTGPDLARVRAPTLFTVGGADPGLLEANRRATREMSCETMIRTLPEDTALFTEPESLARAAELGRAWFLDNFATVPTADHSPRA